MGKELTKEQENNVLLAIDSAEEAGTCEYVINGQPCCVIAQLAVIEGVTTDTMESWRHSGGDGDPKSMIVGDVLDSFDTPLDEYPRALLVSIQAVWDTNYCEIDAREKMRDRLDIYMRDNNV